MPVNQCMQITSLSVLTALIGSSVDAGKHAAVHEHLQLL